MLVTKNLADFCVLMIDDIYGELPSRIFATLLSRGRSALPQLAQHTALTPRQLRHGLSVLIQHSLLYYHVDPESGAAIYEANASAAYNLIRLGKVLETVERLHGPAAKDVMQSLLSLGQSRVSDLKAAYDAKIKKWESSLRGANSHTGETNGGAAPEDKKPPEKPLEVKSVVHLNSVLCQLIRADLVEVVNARSFQSRTDRLTDVEREVKKKYFPEEIRGTKKKEEFADRVADRLRELRDEPKAVKRTLDGNGQGRGKLRKLVNGDITNGYHDAEDSDPLLDPNTVLRVNHEKCAVELRNERLVQCASDAIGETTGKIYAVLLELLTENVPRCRPDPVIDAGGDQNGDFVGQRIVTTATIFDRLDPSIDVFAGIGKAPPNKIFVPAAEQIQKHPKFTMLDAVAEPDGSADEESEQEEDYGYDTEAEDMPAPRAKPMPATNGTNGARESKVKFEDTGPSEESRLSQMRQHLLLLCDSRHHFVRHCGRGQWTVDFEPLIRHLREAELDNVIERKVGRQGLRLARILREKGKLDEKTLPLMALMKKTDVQNKMLEMEMHGFVDIQEVPRDNNRSASRTLFLWFCEPERSMAQLLDSTYKAMVRCLQIREVHRHDSREVLAFVERPDVKGREKEALEKKYFDKYEKYRDVENKLMGQVMRLDGLVALLRDY